MLNSDIVFPEVENSTIASTEIGMGNGDGFINPGESTSISFNLLNNTGSDFSDLNIQINSSDIYLSSENIITISEINSGETLLVEGLILSIPPTILPDSEPLFFVNISSLFASQNDGFQRGCILFF